MWNVLKSVQKNLVWSIPASMALGLAFGYLADPSFLRSWVVPLTFLMVYPMMVGFDVKQLAARGGWRVQAAALLVNFAFTPFLGWAVGRAFFPDRPMAALGLLLAALLPTSGMTISWTGFARGNVSAAVRMTVIGLVAGSLATPVYLKLLMGASVEVSLVQVFTQILFIVFLPLAAGHLTRALLVRRFGRDGWERTFKPRFPLVSTLGVLGIVFVSMALKARAILADPLVLLYYLAPLALLYLVNFLVSTALGRLLFDRGDGIALVYGTVMRNLSIALAVAMAVFGSRGPETALVISLAYVIQVQAAAWYVRLTGPLFGAAAEGRAAA